MAVRFLFSSKIRRKSIKPFLRFSKKRSKLKTIRRNSIKNHAIFRARCHMCTVICELSLLLILSFASRVFLRVLRFSSLYKNELVSWASVVCREYLNVVRSVCGVKAGLHQLLAVNNQPAITNKIFIYSFVYFILIGQSRAT
jgi:hypothetical protein